MPFDGLVLMLWLAAGQPPPATAADIHLVVDTERTFSAATTRQAVEYWFGRDRRYEKVGDRVRIWRQDLGVRWTVDMKKATCIESPLPPSRPPAAPPVPAPPRPQAPPAVEDMHTAGFDYEPAFDWTVRETGAHRTLIDRECREVVATGTADYAETSLTLWACPSEPVGIPREGAALVLGALASRHAGVTSFLAEWLNGHPDLVPAAIEEVTEPAIAGTMVAKLTIRALEKAPPPPGIYDLPPGVKTPGQ